MVNEREQGITNIPGRRSHGFSRLATNEIPRKEAVRF